ncbi:porin [uncultured Pontibacter sp.]|uniref:porin n=1 Tax=uncultured Pontibacter sp. TaxID=453356 RepID=UPI00262933EF|nr:porin [uncultured Pontibacter sp.]
MNNTIKRGLIALLFICLYTFNTQAQTINDSKFGKGLRFVAADSSFSFQLGTRFQLLYQGGQTPATDEWDDRFLIRRARLKFDGFAFSPRLVYKIELGLSNSDIGSDIPNQTNNADNIILDAVAKWEVAPNLHLWVGQTKLPGNRERVISSQKLQFVDRSLLNSRFNLDRDAGLQLHHEHQLGQVVLREIGSISMGEGRDITVNNSGGYNYTGRFEILPFGEFEGGGDYVSSDIEREQTPKLSLAASYDYNDNAARDQAQLGDFLSATRNLRTWFVDAMFKYRGFSAMGEYANRKAPDGSVVLRDELGGVAETFVTGTALNLQAGYLMPSNWEVAGRYTDYTPTAETGLRNQEQYTLGVSRYIVGHSLKVQSDVSLIQEAGRDDRTQFRLQFELAL